MDVLVTNDHEGSFHDLKGYIIDIIIYGYINSIDPFPSPVLSDQHFVRA